MKKQSALKWDLQIAKKVWRGILALSVCGVIYSVLGASFALTSKNVVDSAVSALTEGAPMETLWKACIFLALLVVIQLLMQVGVSELTVRLSGKITILCKTKLFHSLIHKEAGRVLGYHTGELLTRLTSDVSVISTAISTLLPDAIHYVTRALASFVVLYTLDRLFALLCLLVLPIVLFASGIYRKKMKNLHKKVQESDGKTRSFMQETLANLLVIKSFGNEARMVENAGRLQKENYRFNLKRNHISIIMNVFFFIAMTAGYYFALGWGAIRLSQGLMTFGTLTAILQLVEQLQSPFRSLASLLPQYYAMTASTERILELEELPEEETAGEDFNKAEIYENAAAFCVENLTFSYEDKTVLRGVSFQLNKGEFAAVTGLSGAGKSTLLKLFLGIIEPEEGEIYLLTKDGNKIPLDAKTRPLFAYVPQGNMILSGSVRENIAFAKEDATEEEIICAAKDACIWEEIEKLPEGLDTKLGEGGLGLSEGQVQRLAIARALLYDAPILLLDECTSALDEETEKAVLEHLIAKKRKTCCIVSHKAAAKESCNVNFYVENGVIYRLEKN
ncbi:MAG: ABC transporter ATP-binding protein [Clostridia bacterium]|nr:ABC transporter ATP-binding protein [Clostridia bacterium]